MKNKSLLSCIIFFVVTATHQGSNEWYKITERRADYFIIKINEHVKIGSRGTIYSPNKKTPDGTFKVIDVNRNECLCVIETISPDGNKNRIDRVFFKNGENARKTINIRVTGISFTQLVTNKKYFLSDQPIPIIKADPLNLSGIKKILFQIEKNTKNAFSADLISFDQIQQFELKKKINFSDKNKIYLGTHDGLLSMIYEQNGIFHHTIISPLTMKKFKNTIYFYIILRKNQD